MTSVHTYCKFCSIKCMLFSFTLLYYQCSSARIVFSRLVPFWVAHLPPPRVLAYFFDAILCLPPEHPLCLIEVLAVHLRKKKKIALPALPYYFIYYSSRRLLEGSNQLKDASALAGAKIKVVDYAVGMLAEPSNRVDMSSRDVNDVDIVTNARSIAGRIVVPRIL